MQPVAPVRFAHRHRSAFVASGVLLAAVGALFLLPPSQLQAEQPVAQAAPPLPKVTVAPVEAQLVTEYEELTGRIDALETVELRARVSGHIEEVHFQAGQLVRKGDVLFTIDPRWYQAQFDLAAARADMAEREAKRAAALVAVSAISNEEAESRQARAAEARAALATARLDLEHTQVRAPIDGRVSRAFVTGGNLVSGAPGGASLLTTIVTVNDAYVYADLDETTFLKFNRLLRENRITTQDGRIAVELQLADEAGFPRRGYIESTDNRVNPETGSLTLRMIFPNEDRALVPGLFARVRVPISAPQSTLLISERAIGTDQSQKFVLTVGADNTVAYRTVQLGGTIDGKRVVRDGIRAGDRIIVNGLQHVRPGMQVSADVAVAANAPAGSGSNRLASLR
jgi:RND family efflux transporter MFP subunit